MKFLIAVLLNLVVYGEKIYYCNEDKSHPTPPIVEDMTLKHVTIVHRHGDRVRWEGGKSCWKGESMSNFQCQLRVAEIPVVENQSYISPNALFRLNYVEKEDLPQKGCGTGQLTTKGYVQHQINGLAVKKMYVDTGFLKRDYNSSEIHLRSDTSTRVLQSVQSLVSAAFSQKETKEHLNVIDIDVMEENLDSLNTAFGYCAKDVYYDELLKQFPPKEKIQHTNNIVKPLLKKIAKLIDQDSNQINLDSILDCISTHVCHDYAVPDGLDDAELQLEGYAANTYQQHFSYVYPSLKERAPIKMGILVKDWYKTWKQAINEESPIKMNIYSAHDSTLIGIFATLGFDANNPKAFPWPRYAAIVNFELYYDNKSRDHWVRFLYNYEVITLPFCEKRESGLCNFKELEDYVLDIIPKNLEKECQLSTKQKLHMNELLYATEPYGSININLNLSLLNLVLPALFGLLFVVYFLFKFGYQKSDRKSFGK